MANAADTYHFIKFPDYKYREYPKIIDAADGSRIRVNSPEEEEALKAPLTVEEAQLVAEEQAEEERPRRRARR